MHRTLCFLRVNDCKPLRSDRRTEGGDELFDVAVDISNAALPSALVIASQNDKRVMQDFFLKHLELGLGRQLSVKEQVGGFEESRLFSKLLDRIASVAQDPILSIDWLFDQHNGSRKGEETD